MSSTLSALLIAIIPLLEVLFAASNSVFLGNLRLIYIASIILLLSRRTRTAMLLLITGTAFVELVSFRALIGIDAIAFFFAAAITEIFFRFASFVSRDNAVLQAVIFFAVSMLIRHQLFVLSEQASFMLLPQVILANGAILVLALYLYDKLKQPENAFKA